MEKLRKSSILKIICYIAIPILVLVSLLGMIYTKNFTQYKSDLAQKDYYKTDAFVYDDYYTSIHNLINRLEILNIDGNENLDGEDAIYRTGYVLVRNVSNNVYYERNYRNEGYIEYVAISKDGVVYTNVQADDYSKKIEELKANQYYWYKENGKIETNLEQISQNGLSYRYGIETTDDILQNEYNIYLGLNVIKAEENYNVAIDKGVYDSVSLMGKLPINMMIVSIILLLIIAVYLIWSIGYKNHEEGIYLNAIDKFYYEIILAIAVAIIIFSSFIACAGIDSYYSNYRIYAQIVFLAGYFTAYIACAVLGVTTIKRIKKGTLIKSLLIYKIYNWIKRKIKNINEVIFLNRKASTKLIIYYIGFIIISCILISTIETGIGLVVLIVFWVLCLYILLKHTKQLSSIANALKNIYEGKENVKIDCTNFERDLKQIAEYINAISSGLTKAVEESLKSERMKTELITNVSHDIKTPLTSIINYVDLLKKEEMPNEKTKQYLQILDEKSQRLKRLTEDLVEASKASSGNIKLNIEKLNVKELINQISGEYEDKFKDNNLELILKMPKEEIVINADSRYLYRVIENMYSNIVKYSLKGSRVYVDVLKNKDKTIIELKNISKEKLNISADELMQRFVRGETSRNTEGSGLGLSIAESLTKLQGGNFKIHLDGDLFKVVIEFLK